MTIDKRKKVVILRCRMKTTLIRNVLIYAIVKVKNTKATEERLIFTNEIR